jgi:hypothetical protein
MTRTLRRCFCTEDPMGPRFRNHVNRAFAIPRLAKACGWLGIIDTLLLPEYDLPSLPCN